MHLDGSSLQDEKNPSVISAPRTQMLPEDDTMTPYNGVRSIFDDVTEPHRLKDDHLNHERAISKAKLADENIAPFLAKHIPSQYAPLGKNTNTAAGPPPQHMNSRYCYRHRPDLKCRRQADEPSMDHLQWVCLFRS